MKQLGNKKILGFWGVPKTNFDGKPPAHWGECLMNPDKLATLVPMGSPHVNWNDYFVVDKGIPRQGLGCQVLTYVFYDCPNNGKAITATGPEPAVGGSAGPVLGGPEPAIGGSVPNWSDCTSQEFLDNAPHCNILLAGFPCQPWSVAGKGQGKMTFEAVQLN